MPGGVTVTAEFRMNPRVTGWIESMGGNKDNNPLLEAALIGIREKAKELAPAAESGGGFLKKSIFHKGKKRTGTVYTKTKGRTPLMITDVSGEFFNIGKGKTGYGAYVELGTGIWGPKKTMIRSPGGGYMSWIQRSGPDRGKRVWAKATKGQKAQPFMRPAAKWVGANLGKILANVKP